MGCWCAPVFVFLRWGCGVFLTYSECMQVFLQVLRPEVYALYSATCLLVESGPHSRVKKMV